MIGSACVAHERCDKSTGVGGRLAQLSELSVHSTILGVEVDALAEAARAGASESELLSQPVPAHYRGAAIRRDDVDRLATDPSWNRDIRDSLSVQSVPMPEIAPDEVLVAVMASAVNYNTVWAASFAPVPTFQFLRAYAQLGRWESRHDRDYHVLGSDGAGVVVRVGSMVRRWKVGDKVVISPIQVDDQEPDTFGEGMLGHEQRAWGFETNFGGLGDYAVVKAHQLLRKAEHLTWSEAAVSQLCLGTAYRMLVGENGARMKQGDTVLIWGAAGGLGVYASQLVRNGGGTAVGVVSSPEKAELAQKFGCDLVIDRSSLPGPLYNRPDVWRELGRQIRTQVGADPDIVFDHVGKDTFGASVFLAARGGSVVTCGSSTGYGHEYDNRYLWMRVKRIIGSHGGNYQEQYAANELVRKGRVMPVLSSSHDLDNVTDAVSKVQQNLHAGKVGVLCLANDTREGVSDLEARERIFARHDRRDTSLGG